MYPWWVPQHLCKAFSLGLPSFFAEFSTRISTKRQLVHAIGPIFTFCWAFYLSVNSYLAHQTANVGFSLKVAKRKVIVSILARRQRSYDIAKLDFSAQSPAEIKYPLPVLYAFGSIRCCLAGKVYSRDLTINREERVFLAIAAIHVRTVQLILSPFIMAVRCFVKFLFTLSRTQFSAW